MATFTYTYTQTVPATVWSVQHHLNGRPSVDVFSDASQTTPLTFEVEYTSDIHLNIHLPFAATGVAVLSLDRRYSYQYKQDVPSDVWSIEHELGYKPQVSTFTSDIPSVPIVGRVEHTSDSHLNIYFTAQAGGTAYLS